VGAGARARARKRPQGGASTRPRARTCSSPRRQTREAQILAASQARFRNPRKCCGNPALQNLLCTTCVVEPALCVFAVCLSLCIFSYLRRCVSTLPCELALETSRVARRALRVARCALRVACCALRVARCVLRVACCALRVARCAWRVARGAPQGR